jgi:hypothetical protein
MNHWQHLVSNPGPFLVDLSPCPWPSGAAFHAVGATDGSPLFSHPPATHWVTHRDVHTLDLCGNHMGASLNVDTPIARRFILENPKISENKMDDL